MVDLPGCNSQKMSLCVNAGEFLAAARSLPCSAQNTEGCCGQPHIPTLEDPREDPLHSELTWPLLSSAASGVGSSLGYADHQAKHLAVQYFHSLPVKQE